MAGEQWPCLLSLVVVRIVLPFLRTLPHTWDPRMFKQDDLYRSVTDDFSRSNRTNLDENYHILLSGTHCERCPVTGWSHAFSLRPMESCLVNFHVITYCSLSFISRRSGLVATLIFFIFGSRATPINNEIQPWSPVITSSQLFSRALTMLYSPRPLFEATTI